MRLLEVKDRIDDFLDSFNNFIQFGIYAYVAYAIASDFIDEQPLIGTVLLIIIALLIVRFLIKFRSSIRRHRDNQKQKEDIQKLKTITFADPIEKALPTNAMLRRWYRIAETKANEWASDAKLTSLSGLFWIFESSNSPTLHVRFNSLWKEESMSVIEGDGYGEPSYSEGGWSPPNWKVAQFFNYPKWKKAVLAAHNAIASQLSPGYRIHVHVGETDKLLHIGITFKQGRIEKSVFFEFDGRELTRLDNKSRILIS